MKRQQYLKHRLQTLAALSDAVGAMRSLAAHHFRRARQGLAAARTYRTEIDSLVAEIGIRQPLRAGLPVGMLVLASDLGLCGDFNSRLARVAIAEGRQLGVEQVYSVGRRIRGLLTRHLFSPQRAYDAPASLEGISRLLIGLAQDILSDYQAQRIDSLHVISASFEGIGHFQPQTARLLPIAPISPQAPFHRSPYVDPSHLTQVAVREFLYISLYEMMLDSLAAEHGMRLMAAESALEWLEGTSASTARHLSTARGEAATQELLDIVSASRQRVKARQPEGRGGGQKARS